MNVRVLRYAWGEQHTQLLPPEALRGSSVVASTGNRQWDAALRAQRNTRVYLITTQRYAALRGTVETPPANIDAAYTM